MTKRISGPKLPLLALSRDISWDHIGTMNAFRSLESTVISLFTATHLYIVTELIRIILFAWKINYSNKVNYFEVLNVENNICDKASLGLISTHMK